MPGGSTQTALNRCFTLGKSEGPSLFVSFEGDSDGLADEDLRGGFDFVLKEGAGERIGFGG